MVSLPHVPVCPYTTPTALIVAVQYPQAIQVVANSAELAPSPLSASVHTVVVMIATPEMPVAAHVVPAPAVPSTEGSQSVQMAPYPAVFTPEPARSFVVPIPAVEMPIRAYLAPVALVISVQRTQPVLMVANAAEATPAPLGPTMVLVVVVIAANESPVGADGDPVTTIPSTEDSLTIEMPVHALGASPEPSSRPVVVVLLPHVPVRSDMDPAVVPESSQDTAAVEVVTNPAITSPGPAVAAMEAVPVVVASDEMPIAPNCDPLLAIPTAENSQAVEVPADAALAAPEPAPWTVEVILLPEVPVRSNLLPLVQDSSPVEVMANAPVLTPSPLRCAFASTALEVIATIHDPLLGDHPPRLASPPPVLLQPVEVSSHSFSATPCGSSVATTTTTASPSVASHTRTLGSTSGPGSANNIPTSPIGPPSDALPVAMRTNPTPTAISDSDSESATTPSA